MNDASKPIDWAKHAIAIEALARDMSVSLEEVEALYKIEVGRLEQVASIKTYVPVIASRRVRNQLRINQPLELPPETDEEM